MVSAAIAPAPRSVVPRPGVGSRAGARRLHAPLPVPADDLELATAIVNLDAIAANTRALAALAAPARLMAVVKADAFGHGMVPVASTVLGAGATWLGVARVSEALALRVARVAAPVLAWQLEPAWLAAALEAWVDVAASSVDDLDRIAATGPRRRPEVHLKLDTGLHRSGVEASAWPSVVAHARRLEARGRLHVRGIWSHLSHGDVPLDPHNAQQQAALAEGIAIARALGLEPEVTHLANTGGVQQLGAAGCSMVRVGAGLYGIGSLGRQRLRPAMTMTSRVVGVRTVASGEGVGYGHAWTAQRRTQLALVPVGYADGVPRAAGGAAAMLVAGVRAPVVGRISMDQTILDVSGVATPVRIGDPVTIFGDGPEGLDGIHGLDRAPTVEEWAAWAGTIPHEILTGIGERVVRRYAGGRGA